MSKKIKSPLSSSPPSLLLGLAGGVVVVLCVVGILIINFRPDASPPKDSASNEEDSSSEATIDGKPSQSKIYQIPFESDRDGNWEIYVINSDGTSLKRLTNNSFEDRAPTWSPDGKRIVYISDRKGIRYFYTMNPDGSEKERLTTFGESIILGRSENRVEEIDSRLAKTLIENAMNPNDKRVLPLLQGTSKKLRELKKRLNKSYGDYSIRMWKLNKNDIDYRTKYKVLKKEKNECYKLYKEERERIYEKFLSAIMSFK